MSIGYVVGNTHGPEYSWHKYWSRKPSNVISTYLKYLLDPSALVVDPFSGSGVTSREAQKLGHSSLAFDVNPSACLITEFMVHPVDAGEFLDMAYRILSKVEVDLGYLYQHDGETIRYFTHHVEVICEDCKTKNTYDRDSHGKNGKKCVECSKKLSFSLQKMKATRIMSFCYLNGVEISAVEKIAEVESFLTYPEGDELNFDDPLVENRRTLTSRNLSTKDFFTPRNYSILCRYASLCNEVEERSMRHALLLSLTATSAQASRLIASRGGLKGGGQAWTIPGFWVPPIHLESNPFVHLKARIKKMHAALEDINSHNPSKGVARVLNMPADVGFDQMEKEGIYADLVFLDPPYGDSVAFLEFSAIWNSFLGMPVKYKDDISVSDRSDFPMTMEAYEQSFRELSKKVAARLKPSGSVLLTFNNNDLRAWKAIVTSLQEAGLSTVEVNYQDPAVVSTKSQMSRSGSYVGDFYVIFKLGLNTTTDFHSHSDEFRTLLISAATCRGGCLSKGLAYRILLQRYLELNVDASEVDSIDLLITELFDQTSGDLVLKKEHSSSPSLDEMLLEVLDGLSVEEIRNLSTVMTRINFALREVGAPSYWEVKKTIDAFLDSRNQLW